MKRKNIGMGIEAPDKSDVTPDNHCPFNSSLKVRGNIQTGTVISAKAPLSATVKVERQVFIPKYKRYMKKYSKIHVHNPSVINAKEGDVVEFIGCKPISKSKSTVIVRIIEENKQ